MAGWKSVEEIIAYQVSRELRRQVLAATRTGPASKDYDFRRQIRDSARSAPRNLAEGFTRYNHGEFAYHTNVAKASLAETLNHLQDGFEERYFSTELFERMNRLAVRALKACTGLLRHLQTSQAPPPYWASDVQRPSRRRKSPPTAPDTSAPSTPAPSTPAPSTKH